MRPPRVWRGLLGTLALAGLSAPAGAQPVGSEFQINSYTTGDQGLPAVAPDASGNFVVVWRSNGQDGSGYGIFGQRYDSVGEALGTEFRVNSYTTMNQGFPSVAVDASGNFVVVWQSDTQDGSSRGIFGQRYDSAGEALGSEFRVNSYTTQQQLIPSVASDPTGNFVVVWESAGQDGDSFGIFGQRYNSGGVAQGNEFRVNSYTTSAQYVPAVASDAAGNFVVVWASYLQDGYYSGIFGQRYDSAGTPRGGEFQVNTFTTWQQRNPSVAMDAGGNFVVVWSHYRGYLQPFQLRGQRYDSGGDALGGEFTVNSYRQGRKQWSSVASDASGNFVVAWQHDFQDGSSAGIFGQRYDNAGASQGDEFQINSFTTGDQSFPSLGATGTNQFVVTWQSGSQDGNGRGIFGQRYDFSGGGTTLHVGDLDRKAKNVGATWRAQVKTLAHDNNHLAESGVLVTFNVSGGIGMQTCTTVASGVCEVSVVVGDAVPSLTFTVTNLSKVGFSYDGGANHDPDPDSDGTVIVVNQP